MEMTLWESLLLRVWESVTVDQLDPPSTRRAITALPVDVYQAAYWWPLYVNRPFFWNELLLTRPS